MEPMNLDAIMNEIGRSIAEASEHLEEHRTRSFEGTAADDMVKATCRLSFRRPVRSQARGRNGTLLDLGLPAPRRSTMVDPLSRVNYG
jgi:hypothetical protein